MIKIVLFFIFLTSLNLEGQTYILNAEPHPPFAMPVTENWEGDPDVSMKGITVDMLTLAFQRVGTKFKTKLYRWEKAYSLALENENHGVFPTTRTDSREKKFLWVGPLVAEDWFFFGLVENNLKIKFLKDPILKEKRIGALKTGAIGIFLKSKGIRVIEDSNLTRLTEQLKNGEIDIFAVGRQQGYYLANKVGIKIRRLGIIKQHRFLYLAFNLKTPKTLVENLNKELGKMRRDGTVRKLFQKYQR
jgi:polar amino acid transport system substrate-binding protein